MSDCVWVFLLALLGIGLAYYGMARRARRRTGLPSGRVVYQDTEQAATLFSTRYQLAGRPDDVVQHDAYFIPVEKKAGRTPRYPYPGQIMQLIAYCVLVEEHYGVRPPYGIVLFEQTGTRFQIDFTPEREQELVALVQDIRHEMSAVEVHRSHLNPKICAACGYRDRCEERLST